MTERHTNSRDIAIPAEFVTQVTPAGARRLGLVVGIDTYADSGIPNLRAAVADARAMHALMVRPTCGGFDPDQTQLLVGEGATERAIKTALSYLDKHALTDDEVWVYFAGHGMVDRGKHLILPVDADLRHPKASSVILAEFLETIRCQRKVVFLDCCHSGAISGTRNVHSADEVLREYSGRGAATFCSSEEDEKSHELPGENRGAFSYWLERGLLGEADANGDGVVSSGELWEFIRRKVEQDTRDRCGARQTPRFKFDGTGEFGLTRSIATASAKPTPRVPKRPAPPRHDDAVDIQPASTGAPISAETPIEILQKLAANGDQEAQFTLGRNLELGNFVEKDPSLALHWFREAANQGHAPSQYLVGEYLSHGWGVASDQAGAARWFLKSATQGNAAAQYRLAFAYQDGAGCASDLNAAATWMRKACDSGLPQAQTHFGFMGLYGKGVERDIPRAIKWLRKGCEGFVGLDAEDPDHANVVMDLLEERTLAAVGPYHRLGLLPTEKWIGDFLSLLASVLEHRGGPTDAVEAAKLRNVVKHLAARGLIDPPTSQKSGCLLAFGAIGILGTLLAAL